MASLGVLAQLMQGMASSQMDIPRWNPVEEEQARANLQGTRTGNETALLTLFEQKQKQAAEQELMAAIKKDPRLAQLIFGDSSTIGSLMQPQAAPGGAQPASPSLTQQTLMPGQDPSRGAGVSPQGGGPIPPNVAAAGHAAGDATAEHHRLARAWRPAADAGATEPGCWRWRGPIPGWR